ncbi:MAG: type II toxin-antitoxin system PemK/MazF family toxin [Negativicoccus massiliensis]|nr:type II toxin-antitoxin system PemK/MazF family toxin [Negativicoccus massiliensis]
MKADVWEVWWVRFKYEDSDDWKERPAVILDKNEAFVIGAKVTTHEPRKNFPGEYQILRWESVGFECQSTVRLSKRIALYDSDLVRKMGRLEKADIANIKLLLKMYF